MLRYGLKTILAPTTRERTNLMASTDLHAHFRAIIVEQHVVGSLLIKLTRAAHRGNEAVGSRLHRPHVRRVHKDEPTRPCRWQSHRDRCIADGHDLSNFERDAPGDALAARCVLYSRRHLR